MNRILTLIGLAYALCALAELSPDPNAWSGAARAFLVLVALGVILMNAEKLVDRMAHARRPLHRPEQGAAH